MASIKKILLSILLLGIPISSFAQNKSSPFEGVKLVIDGKPTSALRNALKKHQEWLEGRELNTISTYIGFKDSLRANFTGAILSGYKGFDVSDYFNPSFAGVIFTKADLANSNFFLADLRHTVMDSVKLEGTNLNGAKLDYANLSNAFLKNARLVGASLKNAHLGGADMSGVLFEINSEFLPDLTSFRRARNIEHMLYNEYPDALYQLKNNFDQIGRSDISKKVDRAIKYSATRKLFNENNYANAFFRIVFWEWTTNYGLNPFRALIILIGLIPAFAIAYFIAILSSKQLIFRVLPSDRLNGDGKTIVSPIEHHGWRAFRTAMRLSISSAFAVGFREFDIGSWLYRLQGSEDLIRASGWARSFSGAQSLISLILLSSFIISIIGS